MTDLGDLPLYVLTAPVDTQTDWLTPQMDLAALSDNSIHLVVAGASHQSLLDNQSDAAVDQSGDHRRLSTPPGPARPCSERLLQ